MARLNIDLKDEIYASLRARADTEGRTMSDVVRVLVNNWLADKDTEAGWVREIRELQANMKVE